MVRYRINLHAIDPVRLIRPGTHSVFVRLFILIFSLLRVSGHADSYQQFLRENALQVETCRILSKSDAPSKRPLDNGSHIIA
jgi:hypothetical protein